MAAYTMAQTTECPVTDFGCSDAPMKKDQVEAAIAAGIALGSWRAHMRMPPVALEALGASALASVAVSGWIWWVAIDGG